MANQIFDTDGDGKINHEEYIKEDATLAAYRNYLFQNVDFEILDSNGDGFITAEDIGAMQKSLYAGLMEAIKNDDDEWIRTNYMHLTSVWFKEHFKLEPNKSRMLRLDLPIYIFHGDKDPNVSQEGVYDIMERFRVADKHNLKTYIFDGHNHDLNFDQWLTKKVWSEGMLKIFDSATEIFEPIN